MPRGRRHQPPVELPAVGLRVRPAERDARRTRDRKGLVDREIHHRSGVGVLGERTVRQVEQRAERVQRGVVEHLRPEVRDDAGRRFRRDPGVGEDTRPCNGPSLHLGLEGADRHRVGADRHRRAAGRGKLRPEDDARTEHARATECADRSLERSEPVLHADEDAVAGQ